MRLAPVLTLAALMSLTPLALADDGPDVDFLDWGHYAYRVWLLPDVDQRRAALPNDGDARAFSRGLQIRSFVGSNLTSAFSP